MMAAWVVFDWARPRLSEHQAHQLASGPGCHGWRAGPGSDCSLCLCISAASMSARKRGLRPRTGFTRTFPVRSTWKSKLPMGPRSTAAAVFPMVRSSKPALPTRRPLSSQNDGVLTSILLGHVADSSTSGMQTLRVILSSTPDPQPDQVLADLSVTADFTPTGDPRGDPVTLTPVDAGQPPAWHYLLPADPNNRWGAGAGRCWRSPMKLITIIPCLFAPQPMMPLAASIAVT